MRVLMDAHNLSSTIVEKKGGINQNLRLNARSDGRTKPVTSIINSRTPNCAYKPTTAIRSKSIFNPNQQIFEVKFSHIFSYFHF